MKKRNKVFLLLILQAYLITNTCFSQPPPNLGSSLIPFDLEKEYFMVYKTTGGLSEGVSGANVNWNFTSYSNDYNRLVHFRKPSSAIHSNSFSNANDVEVESIGANDTLFTFHRSNLGTGVYEELGTYQISNKKLMIYYKPRVLAQSNLMKFGDSIENSFSGTGSFDSAGITGTISRHGTIRRFYESYGTLMTNWGNITNAARIKTIENFTDSSWLNGTLRISKTNIINFIWVTSTSPGIIHASISHIVNDGKPYDYGYFYCLGCTPSGIKNTVYTPEFSIYPQPAGDYVNIENENFYTNFISISDLNGKLVLSKNIQYFDKNIRISLDNNLLQSGVYILTISNDNMTLAKKLIVKH